MYGRYPHGVSPDTLDAIKKAIRVIDSCETYVQLHAALKYVFLIEGMLDATQRELFEALVAHWWNALKVVRKNEEEKKKLSSE